MSAQAIPDFPERVERAVREAGLLAAKLRSEGTSDMDIKASSEYQELNHLKVVLELETSRTLSETARISSELEQTGMGADLAPVEEER
jgi:hypothetical protein